jgi:hypothetical protein
VSPRPTANDDIIDLLQELVAEVRDLRAVVAQQSAMIRVLLPAEDRATGSPSSQMMLSINEAAATLGVSRRTLDRALLNGAADELGGPVDAGQGKRHHWRFPTETLMDWWRSVRQEPAKEPIVVKPRPGPAPGQPKPRRRKGAIRQAKIDWQALARGDER